MNKSARDIDYLADIQKAISKINRYTSNMQSLSDFVVDELVQDAVLRNIAIIGEAVKKLDKSLTTLHPDVPWGNIAGMRNRLVHDYNGVNLSHVWNTVKKVLPGFSGKIAEIENSLRKPKPHSGLGM